MQIISKYIGAAPCSNVFYPPLNRRAKNNKGFTLIELSIVLVIIGLLVGGVLVGRDLIHQAELRSVVTDWSQFETATRTFKLKYNCIPGDCVNAAQFGLGASGNGNKYTEHSSASTETWQFWTHLATAGLVAGSYTGTYGATNTMNGNSLDDATIGVNVPGSKISGIGYSIWYPLPVFALSAAPVFGGSPINPATHFIATGADTSSGNYQTLGAKMTALDSRDIDIKADDGVASTGIVRAHYNNAAHDITCLTGTTTDYTYDIAASGICNLMRGFIP